MNRTTEAPVLREGATVRIALPGSRFDDCYAVVIDMNSDRRPQDGPIAVYFDEEVPDYQFNVHGFDDMWKGGVPTKADYRDCYRIACFKPEELKPENSVPVDILIKRKFGDNYLRAYALPFPLAPGTHECHVAECASGALATKMTFINVHGVISNFYACEECHRKYDGIRTDGIKLKNPLPGAPPQA